MQTYAEKQKNTFNTLKTDFGYVNTMQAPKVEKIVISTGIGKIKDPKQIELIQDRLARITGQKTAPRGAKKSVASFKVREGDIVGYQVTLRGVRMQDFLDKLINIALPRMRDFRGLKSTAIDEIGNITLGISEHIIFPETSDEEQRNVFGFAITIVTTAKNKKEAEAYLRYIGVPLKRA
ncbi:MAG: 50S ribosomal protein L5 [Candidatus Pacebacteria bacterium]|nr:50S ribosomal protein L5 [Candidatus Paceibacterota bacterium]